MNSRGVGKTECCIGASMTRGFPVLLRGRFAEAWHAELIRKSEAVGPASSYSTHAHVYLLMLNYRGLRLHPSVGNWILLHSVIYDQIHY